VTTEHGFPPSHDPAPARVLTFESRTAAKSLGRALSGAGYDVRTVKRAADLRAHLKESSYDAVVLDLTDTGLGKEALRQLGLALEELPAGPDPARPMVLALAGEEGSGSRNQVPADLWISGRERDQVLKEIEAAIATKRLAEARAEIQRLREAVGLARSTAHDLAQPLTTVLARAQLLMNNLPRDDPNRRAVSIICQEAGRLAGLIEKFQALKEMVRPSLALKARGGPTAS